ncbi:hypothetical protein ACF06Q_19950 [Streptomyces leeuwenhoekii]|jgi:NAD(P)-dependent dehydrogenase (short-subunit alcohol dehydrogenase family)
MNVTYYFRGRTAFVTGAASGIGRTTALAFAHAGTQGRHQRPPAGRSPGH